jgi:hypothetical protein
MFFDPRPFALIKVIKRVTLQGFRGQMLVFQILVSTFTTEDESVHRDLNPEPAIALRANLR